MAANELAPWINSAGENGYRNSMAEFQGDGSTIDFALNFAGGYLKQSDVKAYIYDNTSGLTTDVTAALVWVGPNTVQYTPAIPDTKYIIIYRDSQKTVPMVDFTTNARFTEANLDLVAKQAIFVAAEMVDRFDAINSSSSDAIERSFTALTTAQSAQAQAVAAVTTANNAQTTSAASLANANSAVSVANTAQSVANAIDGKAQSALNASANAVATANTASQDSTLALTTALGIENVAKGAVTTANAASAQVDTANANANAAVATANAVDAKAATALTNANTAVSSVNTEVTNRTAADTQIRTDVAANYVAKTSTAGAAQLPYGTTAQRPAGNTGRIRFNSSLNSLEYFDNNAAWVNTNKPRRMVIKETQPWGTNAGSCIAGPQVRQLNTLVENSIVGASMSGATINLPAGTYFIWATAPCYAGGQHRASITLNSTGIPMLMGTSSFANNSTGVCSESTIMGTITTTAASTNVFLQHYTTTAVANNGLGVCSVLSNWSYAGPEVYSQVIITQES